MRGSNDAEDADEHAPLRAPAPLRREIAAQDAVLDALTVSVTRLGALSEHIADEIKAQDSMLDELEDTVSRADAGLDAAAARSRALARRSGGPGWCACLACLAAMLLALFLMLLLG